MSKDMRIDLDCSMISVGGIESIRDLVAHCILNLHRRRLDPKDEVPSLHPTCVRLFLLRRAGSVPVISNAKRRPGA